jgi:PAS domain S-box-containing protein
MKDSNVSNKKAAPTFHTVESLQGLCKKQEQRINELEQQLKKLLESEMQIQSLMDNIPDIIFFKDLQGRFARINKGCANLLRLAKEEEAYGKTDFDFMEKNYVDRYRKDDNSVIRTQKPMIGKEEIVILDGQKTWLSTTKFPWYNRKNQVIGIFGIARNINHLKNIEEQLKTSNEALEKTVAKRTKELQIANEGMLARLKQLGYLNKKAHSFSQLIDKEELLPAIFDAFVERFPNGMIHFAEYTSEGFVSICSSEGLKDLIAPCLKALDYMGVDIRDELFLIGDWKAHPFMKDLFHEKLDNTPGYLQIPLVTDKKIRGVLQIFTPASFQRLMYQEQTLLDTLASQAAISLDNVNYYKELKEKTRIQSELEVAHSIQSRYTPSQPDIPGYRVKGVCNPAHEVGGDYLDYFQNQKGDWVIVIADVCGKGIPAALIMTSLRSCVRIEAKKSSSSKGILCAVNEFIGPELQRDNSFITCMCLVLSQETGSLNIARAGHPMLLKYNQDTPKPQKVLSKGIAMGMVLGKQFKDSLEEVTIVPKVGDKFVAHTDGVDEAMKEDKEIYGIPRLLDVLEASTDADPEETDENVLSDIQSFTEGHRQTDDLTLFVLEKKEIS